MADKKISELVNLTSLATDDEFVVVDKGANATKRITATNLNTGLNDIPDNKLVPDGGTIGSASDPDAMAVSSGGVVTFSQGIALAAGKGISFAAQTPDGSGTVGSEVLDDYEEGTWTPTIGGTSIVYGTQSGTYTKIGRTVYCRAYLSIASGTPNNTIGGLPFTSFSSSVTQAVTSNFWFDNNGVTLPSGRTFMSALVNTSATDILVRASGSAGIASNVTFSSSFAVRFSLQYDTA